MTISRASRTLSHIGRNLALAGAVAMLVGACAAASGASAPPGASSAEATTAATAATGAAPAPALGAPAPASGAGVPSVSGMGSASSGVAIAYPYPGYPGTPGLAPDHTIVVTGFGRASMAADQSDRGTAQQAALKAALADAKAQADTVATATGVTIQGVLSVSVSSSPGFFGPMPMVVGGTPTNPSSGAPGPPVVVQPPVAPTPELDVTVTVAYRTAKFDVALLNVGSTSGGRTCAPGAGPFQAKRRSASGHLRTDLRRGPNDCQCPSHAHGLRLRARHRTARGCYGAPDSV